MTHPPSSNAEKMAVSQSQKPLPPTNIITLQWVANNDGNHPPQWCQWNQRQGAEGEGKLKGLQGLKPISFTLATWDIEDAVEAYMLSVPRRIHGFSKTDLGFHPASLQLTISRKQTQGWYFFGNPKFECQPSLSIATLPVLLHSTVNSKNLQASCDIHTMLLGSWKDMISFGPNSRCFYKPCLTSASLHVVRFE